MTADELKAAIEEHERRLAELRTVFKAEVANWSGGGPPQGAVDAWTAILMISDRLVSLQEKLSDQ